MSKEEKKLMKLCKKYHRNGHGAFKIIKKMKKAEKKLFSKNLVS